MAWRLFGGRVARHQPRPTRTNDTRTISARNKSQTHTQRPQRPTAQDRSTHQRVLPDPLRPQPKPVGESHRPRPPGTPTPQQTPGDHSSEDSPGREHRIRPEVRTARRSQHEQRTHHPGRTSGRTGHRRPRGRIAQPHRDTSNTNTTGANNGERARPRHTRRPDRRGWQDATVRGGLHDRGGGNAPDDHGEWRARGTEPSGDARRPRRDRGDRLAR